MGDGAERRRALAGRCERPRSRHARHGATPICEALTRATTRSACRSSGRRSTASAPSSPTRSTPRKVNANEEQIAKDQNPSARERVLGGGSVRDQRVASLARAPRCAVARDVARRRSAERPITGADAGGPAAARGAPRAARPRAAGVVHRLHQLRPLSHARPRRARSFPSSTATARRSCRRPASS